MDVEMELIKSINVKLDKIIEILEIKQVATKFVDFSNEPKAKSQYAKKMPVIKQIGITYEGQTEKAVKLNFEGNDFYLPKSQVETQGITFSEMQEGNNYQFLVPEWIWEKKKAEFK